jgi:hypothetical protein
MDTHAEVADSQKLAGADGATQPVLDFTAEDSGDQRGASAPGVNAEPAKLSESDTRGDKKSGKPSKTTKKKKKGNGFFKCGTPRADSSRRKQLIEPLETQPQPQPEPERNPKLTQLSENAPELPPWDAELRSTLPTSDTSTHAPAGAPESDIQGASLLSNSALPRGWVQQTSRSTQQTYYWNPATGETTYDKPDKPCMTEEEWRDYLEEEATN